MANHEQNGHGQSHDHDITEGSRQYYPKGWFIPLVGLVIVAFGFALLGGFVLNHVGTDKWGKGDGKKEANKTEQVAPAPGDNK
ncbi:MAG TPA: hypothetical protein VFU15_05610 [Bacteroidia bacterium]|nr:hypothetical protein [Bacteroidia bacterium]